MLCDICKQKSATVHYTEIINNKIHKMDLCEECAREKNLGFNTQFSVADILKGLTEPTKQTASPPTPACSFCGLTYDRFKKIGRLGCGECYNAFGANLNSLINDVHKNTQHIGKSPASGRRKSVEQKAVSRMSKVEELQEQLKYAVEKEEYEKAAGIRDAIRALQNKKEHQ